MIINPVKRLRGEIEVPGDKSISHRSVMFGSLAEGTTRISHFLLGEDCLSTVAAFRKMGAEITLDGDNCTVKGVGIHNLQAPETALDCGNSGTTTRLISGILAAQKFDTVLFGDASLSKRPMNRIITPLSMMGACIESENGNGCMPLHLYGRELKGITYESPVASAQIKSSVLLAGLFADGETSVIEPKKSRDHSERMLSAFGADITVDGLKATVKPCDKLVGQEIVVPGDISSAAFFMVAAAICGDAELLINNVGVNPTRDGALRVMQAMGADIDVINERTVGGEPIVDLIVRSSSLHGTVIEGDIIPTLIDELPVLAIAAAFADGETIIRDAKELRVKECDRITAMCEGLKAMGVDVEEKEDGMIIRGGKTLHGADIKCFEDHRIAMSFAVAGLAAESETNLIGSDCVKISFPTFFDDLGRLSE